jgi:precorrin-2 dehydrogenase / sirohydrochlorin ferrochelatase
MTFQPGPGPPETVPVESVPAESTAVEPGPVEPGAEPLASRPLDGPLYPVGLVVRGRRCLVVGGGRVAGRKVRSLLQCGAAVTIVAPEVHGALRLLAEDGPPGAAGEHPVDVQRRRYERGEAAGYRLVVAATGDPDVDAAVYEDAEAAGVWVNTADDPAHCTMVLPAVWRTGAVTVSVSTGGVSPALAGWLRTRVAESVGEHVGRLAALLGEARRRLQDEGRPTDSVDWLAILEGPVPALVAQGRLADARAAISLVAERPEPAARSS